MLCLDLSIECFEKARRGRPLKPLQALKDFRIIYDGSGRCSSDGAAAACEKSPARVGAPSTQDRHKSPSRRTRSLSPMKDGGAALRDATRVKGVAKSMSVHNASSAGGGPGKEKRIQQQGSAGAGSGDAAKPPPETTSTARMRPGRRPKEVADSKDGDAAADDVTKTHGSDSTRGKTALPPPSSKSAVNPKQHGAPSQKKRLSSAESPDDNAGLPNRGS